MPIACSTKRTESVLEANYLFPIETAAVNPPACNNNGELATKDQHNAAGDMGLSKRPRKSVFSTLKTKIGPMDLGGMVRAAAGRKNTATVGPAEVEQQQEAKKHSGSMNDLLTSKKDFEMVPTIATCNNNNKSGCDDNAQVAAETTTTGGSGRQFEAEAKRYLNNWGISSAMLEQAMASGARNELVGMYRIVLHRLEMQEERRKSQFTKDALNGGEGDKSKKLKAIKMNIKGDGGCGGKCSISSCVVM